MQVHFGVLVCLPVMERSSMHEMTPLRNVWARSQDAHNVWLFKLTHAHLMMWNWVARVRSVRGGCVQSTTAEMTRQGKWFGVVEMKLFPRHSPPMFLWNVYILLRYRNVEAKPPHLQFRFFFSTALRPPRLTRGDGCVRWQSSQVIPAVPLRIHWNI